MRAQRGAGRVLIVDDDEQVRRVLRRTYERSDWTVIEAGDGRAALRALFEGRPDVVVLDVSMEGLDGYSTLERIREVADVPVLMLTGLGGELDKVRALRSGADDYVTKPFGNQEVLARTEALKRRAGARAPVRERYDDGSLCVDFAASTVTLDGAEVALTPQEYRLLGAFVRHPGQVLGYEQLLELAWHNEYGTRDQVKIYVGYVRRKLGTAAERIETVRGFGYRYRSPGGG